MMADYLLGHGADASAVSMVLSHFVISLTYITQHNDTPFELVPPHQRDAMRDVFERHGEDIDVWIYSRGMPLMFVDDFEEERSSNTRGQSHL